CYRGRIRKRVGGFAPSPLYAGERVGVRGIAIIARAFHFGVAVARTPSPCPLARVQGRGKTGNRRTAMEHGSCLSPARLFCGIFVAPLPHDYLARLWVSA